MVSPQSLEDEIIISEQQASGLPEIRVEPCPRWVRAYLAGIAIADSKRVLTVFESRHLPIYYFPLADIRTDLLEPSDREELHPILGIRSFFHLRVGNRLVENAAWQFSSPPAEVQKLGEHMAIYWHSLDQWYEEDDEVFVHPRDPYHRVDVLNSSRHVRVHVGGDLLADSHRPRLLFETSLPTRYYLPRMDVRVDLLSQSETITQCPYKGRAIHYDLRLEDRIWHDIAWSYPFPIPECPKIEHLICFYDERVDAVEVDGELQPRPHTPWS